MNKPLILVVEDDIPVRNLITITLKTHGYRYLTAGTGDGAVVEASSHNPDVVLLDLGLPDMDGVYVESDRNYYYQLSLAAGYGRRRCDPENTYLVQLANHCDQCKKRRYR